MGGFEGGDEGGFWDVDAISELVKKQKHHKKTTHIEVKDSTYSIKSFRASSGVYNTISFVPCKCDTFSIEGSSDLESNAIYKAYIALYEYTADSDILEYFQNHKVVTTKESDFTDALAFMTLLKEVCNLVISTKELEQILQTMKTRD